MSRHADLSSTRAIDAAATGIAVRPTVSSVIERLQLSRTHINILIIAALGVAFDSFDTYIVSYAMPSITAEWKLDPIATGVLASAGIWGMFLGAIIWGPLADQFGRKAGFSGTILGFAALSGLTALAGNVYQFGILRFVTGMCLGGMIPISTALVSEYMGTRARGRCVAFITTVWPLGLLVAAGCALALVPLYGWRVLFIMGVIPASLTLLIRRQMPESPRWLSSKGRLREAVSVLQILGASDDDVRSIGADEFEEKVPFIVLIQSAYLKRFILTAGYYFFAYFGYYGFVLWLPSILATVYHLSLVTTFTYTLLVAIAALAGRVTGLYTVEKFGRKQLFYVGFGLGGVAALVFGTITNARLLVWGACILSFLYEQGVAGTVVWTAELYPSRVRATAVSWSTSAGRVSAAVSPVVFGWFVKNHMYYDIYVTMAAMFWVAVALAFFLGVETKGKSLQELGAA
jgi:MFS transporter, putative metabolite:H+ symporter